MLFTNNTLRLFVKETTPSYSFSFCSALFPSDLKSELKIQILLY